MHGRGCIGTSRICDAAGDGTEGYRKEMGYGKPCLYYYLLDKDCKDGHLKETGYGTYGYLKKTGYGKHGNLLFIITKKTVRMDKERHDSRPHGKVRLRYGVVLPVYSLLSIWSFRSV
jgi:hypothetical protein